MKIARMGEVRRNLNIWTVVIGKQARQTIFLVNWSKYRLAGYASNGEFGAARCAPKWRAHVTVTPRVLLGLGRIMGALVDEVVMSLGGQAQKN